MTDRQTDGQTVCPITFSIAFERCRSLFCYFSTSRFFILTFFFLDRQTKQIQTYLGNCPCGTFRNLILLSFFFFCNWQQHSSCRHFHVSLHADGRLTFWPRPSLPSVRVQVLPGPEHLSLRPNWNPKRNAIRSAWPDAEEGWLRVGRSKQKKEKWTSGLRPHSCCRGDHLEAFK